MSGLYEEEKGSSKLEALRKQYSMGRFWETSWQCYWRQSWWTEAGHESQKSAIHYQEQWTLPGVHFLSSLHKFHLNYVYKYNSSFSGSPLWDLFSRESEMIENTWNTSARIMFDLSFRTHRYFVEPVSGKVHIKNILLKRFLGFLNQIKKSSKILPSALLRLVSHDTRSTTGSNLRKILLLTEKTKIEDITIQDIDNYCYAPARQEDP